MSVHVTCGQCAREFRIGQEYAGTMILCPRCRSPIQVPGPGAGPAPAAASSSPPARPVAAPIPPAYTPPPSPASSLESLLDDWAQAAPADPAASGAASPPGLILGPLGPMVRRRRRIRVRFEWGGVLTWLARSPSFYAIVVGLTGIVVSRTLASSSSDTAFWALIWSMLALGLGGLAGTIWWWCVVLKYGSGLDIFAMLIGPLLLGPVNWFVFSAGKGEELVGLMLLIESIAITIYELWWVVGNWRYAGRCFCFRWVLLLLVGLGVYEMFHLAMARRHEEEMASRRAAAEPRASIPDKAVTAAAPASKPEPPYVYEEEEEEPEPKKPRADTAIGAKPSSSLPGPGDAGGRKGGVPSSLQENWDSFPRGAKGDSPVFAAGKLGQSPTGRGGPAGLRIPAEWHHGVAFGDPGCPVAIVKNGVWQLSTGRLVQTLEGAPDAHATSALSRDGRWFAAVVRVGESGGTSIGVWSTQTGKRVLEVPGEGHEVARLLDFSGEKFLLVGRRVAGRIDVWDVEAGKQLKGVALPKDAWVDSQKVAFTPDSACFATATSNQVLMCATASGTTVATMEPPAGRRPAPVAAEKRGAQAPVEKQRRAVDASLVYASICAMKFSPDGEELAAVSVHPEPQIMVWDRRGKMVFNEYLVIARQGMPLYERFEWLPEGWGWLIGGDLYDRRAKRVVMRLVLSAGLQGHVHLVDKDHLVGRFGKLATHLEVVTIPSVQIRRSLAQVDAGVPAPLRPGEPVSIGVEFAGLDGSAEEVGKMLAEALAQRLSLDGIPVEDGRPTVFRIGLVDKAAELLKASGGPSMPDVSRTKTVPPVANVDVSVVIELWVPGQAKPRWRAVIEGLSGRLFSDPRLNDPSRRKNMLDGLCRQLCQVPLPYFVPESSDYVPLPLIVQ